MLRRIFAASISAAAMLASAAFAETPAKEKTVTLEIIGMT